MRILFNAYPTHCQGGGAVVKMRKLREYLQKVGHQVDCFDPWRTKIRGYDIYHHFSWFPADLPMIRFAKAEGVKIVIETMYWDSFRYALRFPALGAPGRAKALVNLLMKTFLPWLTSGRRILTLADLLMPNSQVEANLLVRHFGVDPRKISVALNGVDKRFSETTSDLFFGRYGLRDFVLCTGMIEPRKNQLTLIRALKGTHLPLVLMGNCPGIHRWYYERCRKEANPNVHFLENVDHDDPLLASAYAASGVLAVPSWHETTSKSALEAALAGKNIVMTTYAPAAREYLGDRVFYVNPGDMDGLRKAIRLAHQRSPDPNLKRRAEQSYLWETVAGERVHLYEQLLA